jgi:DNA-binding MarR family transcriptional regulator
MDAVYTAPGYLFRRMEQIAVALFMEECRAFDLTPVQYGSLIAIHTHPGIDATRLSAVIAFDRSTLGSVIERLEAKRLIDRKPSPEDKRVKLLYITRAGAAVLRDIMPSVEKAQARSGTREASLLRSTSWVISESSNLRSAGFRGCSIRACAFSTDGMMLRRTVAPALVR